MTRPWWERSYKQLSKSEIWERVAAAADQRNFTATMSIADIAAEVENDRCESVMKLTQAHDLLVETVHATLHKDLPLSGSRPAERSNCFTKRQRRSDPECARRSQRWPPQLFDHLGTMFSMLVGRLGAKSKVAGIRLNQEASLYELEGVQKMVWRRMSPRCSGSS